MAKYTYDHLIPENVAPQGATSITAYCNGQKVCSAPLGRLAQPVTTKNYSFLALSDIHLTYDTADEDFCRALTYAETDPDCVFTCICGDLTSTGSITEGAKDEMALYRDEVYTYAKTKPVYAISGNHETSYGVYVTDERISPYTGHGLFYSFEHGGDVFIMLGYYGAYHEGNGGWRSSEIISHAELQFLYDTLEDNRNRRCFVFNHVYPYQDRVGDANRLQNAKYWDTQDGGVGQAFVSLLKHYKNTTLFHGHSHIRFEYQELDKMANYSSEVGYRSVHIPSLSVPRGLKDDGSKLEYKSAESEGYVVDVYDDYIILNGRDFVDNDSDGHIIPIATYKIDTTLHTVEAGTFVDETGLIQA